MRKRLVFWDIVCKSKSQGGLDIIDLKILNQALLAKLWVRFKDPHVTGMWKTIILAKYEPLGISSSCSLFWSVVLKDTAVVEVAVLPDNLIMALQYCSGRTYGVLNIHCSLFIQIYLFIPQTLIF